MTGTQAPDRLANLVSRLSASSEKHFYNPYALLEWPDALPEAQYWMPAELLSTYATAVDRGLTDEQRWAISKWESINFYSLNVHGIRELLLEMVGRIHTKKFSGLSEFLHHVIGEENIHMWFFAKFCQLYGGQIYPNTMMRIPAGDHHDEDVVDLLVFARLLIFEEIVDVVNRRTAADERICPTIRKLNDLHHQDESRHIAFGRGVVAHLFDRLQARRDSAALVAVEEHLKRFMVTSVASLCSPAVYRDAGLEEPYRMRREALADGGHDRLRHELVGRTAGFMTRIGIFATPELVAA